MRIPEKPKNTPSNNILGINLDGERLLTVYGNPTGIVFERSAIPVPVNSSFMSVLDLIMIQADKLLNLTKAQHLPIPDRISVAISGNLDYQSGVLESATDFPDWRKEPLRSQLTARFNLPVFIEQRANAGALAEYYFGLGQKMNNMVFVSMSPSLRAGVITNGMLYRNPGGTAGQLGSMLVNANSLSDVETPAILDDYVSSQGLVKLAALRHPTHWEGQLYLMQIVQAAQNGDPFAREVFREAGLLLGQGLADLSCLLYPELIIIGHPGCLIDAYLLEPAREMLSRSLRTLSPNPPVLAASQLCGRLPELQALAPAIHAARSKE